MAVEADPAELARSLAEETARLGRELDEIELLVGQARQEATRHEAKRAALEQRLAELQARHQADEQTREAAGTLMAATRRAALMEAQIDVLEGKAKTVGRMRDRLGELAEALAGLPTAHIAGGPGDASGREPGSPEARVVLDAQEDLRRDIARAMHDGPAQSLTNITLQAQIVQRLLKADPARAEAEVALLVNMVQQTLEATKTFIFDVRPMVLDDLGLVPTLRRAARDRGGRAQLPIDFETQGADRRLPAETESAFFRIVDEALVGYLETDPARLSVRLDWTERGVRAEVRRVAREGSEPEAAPRPVHAPKGPPPDPSRSANLLPALAAMIEERQEDERSSAAAAAAARAQARALPAATWRDIRSRAAAAGVRVELSDDGQRMTALVEIAA